MSDEFEANEGLTRREVLKKGAILGGALVWTVPMVQTVGMSAAYAAPGSEQDCCLRIQSLVAVANSPDVDLTLTVENCSTQRNAYDVSATLQRRPAGGGAWVDRPSQSIGTVNKTVVTSDPFSDTPGTGTWIYRAHATYRCPETNSPLLDAIGPEWTESGPVTV